jgi:alpha-L-rhamnosidase
MVKLYRYTILVILLLFSYFLKGESSSLPVGLKTDHLENPIGIDNPNPRLAWRIEDNREGARQFAYRLLSEPIP